MAKSLKKSNGNAMTEFAVLALVMVPAMAFIPMIGKVSDVNQATTQAARYAAWERTVSDASQKSDAQIATEIHNRFFVRNDTEIESDEEMLSAEELANPMWSAGTDEEGNAISLVNTQADGLFVNIANRDIPDGTGADVLTKAISEIGGAMDGIISGAEWDVEEKGFYVAEVGVDIVANKILSAGSDCNNGQSDSNFVCVSRRNAIFVDAWNADTPDHAEARVKSLVPAGALQPVGDFLSNIGVFPLFSELKGMKDMFGDVQEDVLPLDRYGDE